MSVGEREFPTRNGRSDCGGTVVPAPIRGGRKSRSGNPPCLLSSPSGIPLSPPAWELFWGVGTSSWDAIRGLMTLIGRGPAELRAKYSKWDGSGKRLDRGNFLDQDIVDGSRRWDAICGLMTLIGRDPAELQAKYSNGTMGQ
ncbi:hypothetical protein EDD22DRAFT_853239 [Suillus occidentalis]|nr:hypothetical protein EDD22DRAFT_853239 [Suillus occidentalis]